jgi:hypothetical protein
MIVRIAMLVTLMACAGLTVAKAQPYPPEQGMFGLLPPSEAMAVVRGMGFDPLYRPVLYGSSYIVRALDDRDIPVRVIVDARSGKVLAVRQAGMMRPRYGMMSPYGYEPRYREYVPLPPQTVPSGRYGSFEEPSLQDVPRARERSAAIVRTPLPRQRPPTPSKAASDEATNVRSSAAAPSAPALKELAATPGKSIPAPVARRVQTPKPEEPTTLVPPAPLY